MAFDIFPDLNTAALWGKRALSPIPLAPGEATRAFAPMPQHVGADPSQPGVNATFLRFAVGSYPPGTALSLHVELSAGDPTAGAPTALVDPAVADSIAAGVELYDGVNPTSAATAYFDGPSTNNVYLLKVAIEIPGAQLRLRIVNHNAVACAYVWTVADNDEDSKQPWLNLRAAFDAGYQVAVEIDAYIGQAASLNAEPLVLSNQGTGPVTISGAAPPDPRFLLTGLPLTLGANRSAADAVKIGFDKPTAAGVTAPVVLRLLTRDKPDPGPFGDAHNESFTLTARVGYNDVWATRKPMITGRSSLGLTPGAGGLYALGGFDPAAGATSKKVERYEPDADRWSLEADAPTARLSCGVAAALDGTIYVIGGDTGDVNNRNPLATNEAFDPIAGRWRTLRPMPTPRFGLGLAAGADGLLYAVGGFNARFQPLAVVEAYDPALDQWVSRQPMLMARGYFGLAAADDGKIYAAGGLSPPTMAMNRAELFDPLTQVWTIASTLLTARNGFGFASGRNGRLYAIGGATPAGETGRVEEFDPATKLWTPRADMPVARSFLGLAVAPSGRLYAIGGGQGATTTTVEEFTP